jgi:hypothetical protein
MATGDVWMDLPEIEGGTTGEEDERGWIDDERSPFIGSWRVLSGN